MKISLISTLIGAHRIGEAETQVDWLLTDSRSLLSYPRHHYFRRILCNYLGNLRAKNEITQDIKLVGSVIQDISYNNAIKYFGV